MNEGKNKSPVPGLPVRLGALFLLRAVLERRQSLDDNLLRLMESKIGMPVSDRDKSHIRAIASTVLRRLGQIDGVLDSLLKKPLPRRAKGAEFILRIGIAELLFLKSSPHAVVNTALEVAKLERGLEPYTGLINATLRRVSQNTDQFVNCLKDPLSNIPDWLAERWKIEFGKEIFLSISQALSKEPPLDLTAANESALWASNLGGSMTPTGSIRLNSSTRIEKLEGFNEGKWWVQDAAASIPATLFGDLNGQEVLDLCAAPGGKTMQLANSGAKVTSVDRSSARLQRLANNLKRVNLSVELVEADISDWNPKRKWKYILLDPPCSATGTTRRHPDILQLKTEEEINRLVKLQFKLLNKAVSLLEKDGTLVYCSCSLEPEEGKGQLSALLSEHQDLETVPIEASEIGGQSQFLTQTGAVQTLPCHWPDSGGLDGFFAFRLTRK